MFLVALACTTPESDDGSADTPPDPPPDTDTDTSVGDTDEPPAPEVPLIAEALAGRCPEPNSGEPLKQGADMHRVTLVGLGHCNDGSPPVLYVRAATDPAHENHWVWLFDGGGFCPDYEGCAARWCGEDPPYGARHMSSLYLPATKGGEGITAIEDWNEWRGWNHVFAAYCSSDTWLGSRGEYVFEGEPDYRLYFEGDLVAADGVAAGVAGIVSDDGVVAMPLLSDATTVVVGGISAGCHGAALHNEKVATAAPLAQVVTVLDSTFYSSPEVTDATLEAVFVQNHTRIWNDTANPAWGAVLDAACAADHPTEPWRCLNLETLMSDGYLEGSVLWNHDLRDPVVYKYYEAAGVTEGAYQQLGVDTFRYLEDTVPSISIYGYSCGIHTVIDGDGTFSSFSVVDAENGGSAVTVHDALQSVLAGGRVGAVDRAPAPTSSCD